jgi:transmembrane sensor
MKQDHMNTTEQTQTNINIANYLSGKASENEVSQLNKWISSSSENRDYFLQVKNIWETSDNPFNPSDISTNKALRKVLKQIESRKTSLWGHWQRAAAILFIPLLAGSFWWGKFISADRSSDQVVYNEVFAAFGTRSAIKLADGSKVWLNSGSSLSYPNKFINQKRIVKLKGEAYFEVQSDVSRPFIVQTQSISVTATGTKFDVQAYPKMRKTQVTLVSGIVLVKKMIVGTAGTSIAELKPNQHLVYDTMSGIKELKDENIYRYIAWKEGKLIFRNESLSEVVEKISLLYNVEIELQGKNLQDNYYRATFQDESLEDILKLLKLSSPIDYKEMKRSPLPDGSFPKKKIIIFPLKK